jgi:hypothetical protein
LGRLLGSRSLKLIGEEGKGIRKERRKASKPGEEKSLREVSENIWPGRGSIWLKWITGRDRKGLREEEMVEELCK